MEKVTINELVTNEKYSQYLPKNEIKFFKKMHRFNVKKRVIEKLKRVYSHVECEGRGDHTTFTLGEQIEGAVVDKRSIATTNPVVLKMAQNANMSLTRSMIGEHFTAKRWLSKFGVRLPFISKQEFFDRYNNNSDYGAEIETGVNINDYVQPDIHEVLNSELAQKQLAYIIDRFYGRFFQSVASHSK